MLTLKVIKATGIYTILGFIPLVSSFILLPIYTQFLDTADYGIVALGGLTESYFMILLTFGLPMAFSVFFFDHEKKPGGINQLLSNTLSAIIGNATLFAVILVFFGNWLFDLLWDGNLHFEKYGWYIFINCVFLALNQILFQYYRIQEDLMAVVVVTIAPFICSTIGGILGVVVFDLGAYGSITYKAVGTVIGSLPFYLFTFGRIGFKLNKNIIKGLYDYAYPFVIIFFLTTISETVDKFLLNKYFDLQTLGLYNFSSVIVSPVAILIQSYWNSVTPSMYRVTSQDAPDKESVVNMYFKGTLLITLLAIWVLIMVVDPVVKIVANAGYHSAIYFVPILAIAVVGRAYFNIYTFKASFYKKTKFLPIINVVSFFVGVGTAFFLMPFLGICAILISALISRLTQGLMAYALEKTLKLNSYSILNQLGFVILSFVIIYLNYAFLYNNPIVSNGALNFIEGLLFFSILLCYYRSYVLKMYTSILKRK